VCEQLSQSHHLAVHQAGAEPGTCSRQSGTLRLRHQATVYPSANSHKWSPIQALTGSATSINYFTRRLVVNLAQLFAQQVDLIIVTNNIK